MNVRSVRAKVLVASSGLLIAAATGVATNQAGAAPQGADSAYVVLYRSGASSADAAATVNAAGGTVVANYQQIGVVIARSASANFATAVQRDSKVSGAARTDGLGVRLNDDMADGPTSAAPLAPAASDSLSGLQ